MWIGTWPWTARSGKPRISHFLLLTSYMPTQLPIYLDNNATTPIDERVLDAMLPYLKDRFGNAASRTHTFGWHAEDAVDLAREQIASLINAQPKDIIFTSGATESDNLAIKGVAAAANNAHIITQATEHHAVLDSCRALERGGVSVTVLPVDSHGIVDPSDIANAITDNTVLVSIMAANNEIGTCQAIEEIGAICRAKNIYFHTDAAQAIGKCPLDIEAMHIDLLSISSHKLYGPKGAGALYVRSRPRVRLVGQIDGGGHEKGMRSGTLNVPGIVGLGEACALAQQHIEAEAKHSQKLRHRLQKTPLQRAAPNTTQRPPRTTPTGQSQHQLCRRGWRKPAYELTRCGPLIRLGLYIRISRTILCAQSHWRQQRHGAVQHSLWHWPVQYRR